MTTKIDFSKILLDHFKTLRDHESKRLMISDILLFFVFPLALSTVVIVGHFELKDNFVTIIVTAASIFAGLLLNLLVLIYTIFIRDREKILHHLKENTFQTWQELVRQTFANVSFSILVSLLLVALCLLFYLDLPLSAKRTVEFLLYFFCATLVLHLFMVLGRIHMLIAFEIS
jgi:hypothetical protein